MYLKFFFVDNDLHNQKSVQMSVQRWLLFGGFKDGDDVHVGTFSAVSFKAALSKISQNKLVSNSLNAD